MLTAILAVTEPILIQPLSFGQLVFLIILIIGLLSGLLIFLSRKGLTFRRKGNTVIMGSKGEKIKLSEEQARMLFLLVQSFRVNENMFRVEHIAFTRQKKIVREMSDNLRQYFLHHFRHLYDSTNSSKEMDTQNLLADKSYLMFTLILDRIYNTVFDFIMQDVEQNGLAKKQNPEKYADERSKVAFITLRNAFSGLYYGVDVVTKSQFMFFLDKNEESVEKRFTKVYGDCIDIAQHADEKKEELKLRLFENISEAHNLDMKTVEAVFSSVKSEDFIDI